MPVAIPGTYRDGRGSEDIEWRLVAAGEGRPSFVVRTTIRGVAFSAGDFLAGLEADDQHVAVATGFDQTELAEIDCLLTATWHCLVSVGGTIRRATFEFSIDFRGSSVQSWPTVSAALTVGGTRYEATDDGSLWNCMWRIRRALPTGTTLVACFACRWSEVDPLSDGGVGINCHREVASEGKIEKPMLKWRSPDETVPIVHHCDRFEPSPAESL